MNKFDNFTAELYESYSQTTLLEALTGVAPTLTTDFVFQINRLSTFLNGMIASYKNFGPGASLDTKTTDVTAQNNNLQRIFRLAPRVIQTIVYESLTNRRIDLRAIANRLLNVSNNVAGFEKPRNTAIIVSSIQANPDFNALIANNILTPVNANVTNSTSATPYTSSTRNSVQDQSLGAPKKQRLRRIAQSDNIYNRVAQSQPTIR